MVTAGMDIQVTDLADLAGEPTPPCSVWWSLAGQDVRQCSRPSAVRLIVTCSNCGYTRSRFLCGPCYEDARKGELICGKCRGKGCSTFRET